VGDGRRGYRAVAAKKDGFLWLVVERRKLAADLTVMSIALARFAGRALTVLFAAHYLVVGVFGGAGAAAAASAFKCDDGCSESGDWSRFEDAWQWDALLVVALASSVFGMLVFASWRRGTGLRLALFGVQAALLAVTALAFYFSDHVRVSPELALLVGSAEAAGFAAILLAPPSDRSHPETTGPGPR
jgi:hypothetical protein